MIKSVLKKDTNKNRTNIILNSKRLKAFPLILGIKKGYPL